jgi:hypothetical protein
MRNTEKYERRRKDGTVMNVPKTSNIWHIYQPWGLGNTCEWKKRCLCPDSILTGTGIRRDSERLGILANATIARPLHRKTFEWPTSVLVSSGV